MIPFANGVDVDEFVHTNILELLIKNKIMAIKKSNASNRTFKNLFRRKSRSSRNNSSSDIPHHPQLDEKKLNIAIVELPKLPFDEQPVIINIEDPIFTQGNLDSISLYNIEITGDRLIDYNLDVTHVPTKDDEAKNNYSSDNQSVNSSYTSFAAAAKTTNRSNVVAAAAKAQLPQQREEETEEDDEEFCLDYEFVEANLNRFRKHSLETVVPRVSKQSFRETRTGMNLDDQRFVKLCLSDSDISKTSNFLTKPQTANIQEECQVPLPKHSKKHKKRHKQQKRRAHRRTLEDVMGVEVIESDDLPERARWTIIFTAVLLLVMCLFLVGITLRMAPLIDDIVRQENERLKFQSMKVQLANKNLTELLLNAATASTNSSVLPTNN
ncbi:uncharacterized protein LOC134829165 [Culicoides brevitarsis]|uniref:uncharacterized protein LOC134829165 n=1 Tax=Culicoides brevitarsis TaxID=469753 RepID=UPI00307C2036